MHVRYHVNNLIVTALQESVQHIFTYSFKRRSQWRHKRRVSSSLELHPGQLNYGIALQRQTVQTALLPLH